MKNNKEHTALLVMDMQTAILNNLPKKDDFVSRVNNAIGHARKHDIPVLFIHVGFRKNVPEIDSNNKMFGGFKKRIMEVGD